MNPRTSFGSDTPYIVYDGFHAPLFQEADHSELINKNLIAVNIGNGELLEFIDKCTADGSDVAQAYTNYSKKLRTAYEDKLSMLRDINPDARIFVVTPHYICIEKMPAIMRVTLQKIGLALTLPDPDDFFSVLQILMQSHVTVIQNLDPELTKTLIFADMTSSIDPLCSTNYVGLDELSPAGVSCVELALEELSITTQLSKVEVSNKKSALDKLSPSNEVKPGKVYLVNQDYLNTRTLPAVLDKDFKETSLQGWLMSNPLQVGFTIDEMKFYYARDLNASSTLDAVNALYETISKLDEASPLYPLAVAVHARAQYLQPKLTDATQMAHFKLDVWLANEILANPKESARFEYASMLEHHAKRYHPGKTDINGIFTSALLALVSCILAVMAASILPAVPIAAVVYASAASVFAVAGVTVFSKSINCNNKDFLTGLAQSIQPPSVPQKTTPPAKTEGEEKQEEVKQESPRP